MAPLADSIVAKSLVLWNIIDVHFDELEFALEQFERGLEDPVRTLDDLARFPEQAIAAHVDGLVVGGDEVRTQLLEPALQEPSPQEPAKAVAAALAIIAAGRYEVLWTAIQSSNPAVRRAVARAAAFDPQPRLDDWIRDKLSRHQDRAAQLGLLELCAARQLPPPPNLIDFLQSTDLDTIATAARSALHAEPARHLPVIEQLLEHEAPLVRSAALTAALAWRSAPGWKHCERVALEADQPDVAALYAALGGRRHHERLRERLTEETARPAVLFALGFSGNAAMVPELVPYLRSTRALEVKIAAQSIALITGLDLEAKDIRIDRRSPEVAELPPPEDDPEAHASLPPLESDDLEADLVPPPEESIPEFDVAAVERHCKSTTLEPGRRWLGGAAFGPDVLLDYLERTPMRRHHVLSRALCISTGGTFSIDSRACTRWQRSQLAGLLARGLSSALRAYQPW
jgi:uncharacterized protein (TIGR02270 family)